MGSEVWKQSMRKRCTGEFLKACQFLRHTFPHCDGEYPWKKRSITVPNRRGDGSLFPKSYLPFSVVRADDRLTFQTQPLPATFAQPCRQRYIGWDMRITFELESADIERFQGAFERARHLVSSAEEIDIIDAAKQALDAICIDQIPGYVRKRLVHVQRLIMLLEDEEWNLRGPERSEALAALVYFGDPDDLIPDHLEVIGLIDDAIMLEFIARRMRHVLAVYRQFCTFRNALDSAERNDSERIARAHTLAHQRSLLVGELNARRERLGAWIEQPA